LLAAWLLAAGLLSDGLVTYGMLAAALATFFKMAFDGFLTLFFGRFFFLADAFFDGAIAFLIIEFVEIVGLAFKAGFGATGLPGFSVAGGAFAVAARFGIAGAGFAAPVAGGGVVTGFGVSAAWFAAFAIGGRVATRFGVTVIGLTLGGSGGSCRFHVDNLLFYNSNEV
jgi:hypothetical protein